MKDRLAFLSTASDARVVIVSPHPDDEVIGAGARLPLLRNATVIQVTDGSPNNMTDARALGFDSRQAYAAARAAEVRKALALAGALDLIELGVPDQEASTKLSDLTFSLASILNELAPEYVLTVPYEGGHPDHDATAFAVHRACSLIDEWKRPTLVEMLSYHNESGACQMCAFLDESAETLRVDLTPAERELKRAQFDCFASQRNVLQWFPIAIEKFRLAPAYDFSTPPHAGQLYYEMWPWGMDGRRWRELARAADAQICLCAS